MRKALAKKPEARYQTADEMIADLDSAHSRILGLNRTVTRMIAPAREPIRQAHWRRLSDIFKRPRLSIGYVAAAVFVIAVVGFIGWR